MIKIAVFLGVHKFPPEMDETQVSEGWNTYKQSASSKGLKPLRALVSLEKGFAYCQTEAENAQQVWDAHKDVQIPLEDVIEVKVLN